MTDRYPRRIIEALRDRSLADEIAALTEARRLLLAGNPAAALRAEAAR